MPPGIKAEENLEGKYLLRCSDPKLLAADMAAGYKHLLEVDVCRPATARKSASVNLGSAEAQALAPMDGLGT